MQDTENFIEEIKNDLGEIENLSIEESKEKIDKISFNLLKSVNEYSMFVGKDYCYYISPGIAKIFKNNLETIEEKYNKTLIANAVAICLKAILHMKQGSEINLVIEKQIFEITGLKGISEKDKNIIEEIIRKLMKNLYIY